MVQPFDANKTERAERARRDDKKQGIRRRTHTHTHTNKQIKRVWVVI